MSLLVKSAPKPCKNIIEMWVLVLAVLKAIKHNKLTKTNTLLTGQEGGVFGM